MTHPFPQATTRNEARDNALWYANESRRCAEGQLLDAATLAAQQSQVWSAIAETFPMETHPFATIIEDDDADRTEVLHVPAESHAGGPEAIDAGDGRVAVDPRTYDILRVLAVRYVLSSFHRSATIDPQDMGELDWGLEFAEMPDSGVIQVTLARMEA